jgi:tRNA A-37 threonylcarbamoyl transferase component Bud32
MSTIKPRIIESSVDFGHFSWQMENYNVNFQIGEGANGFVFLVTNKTLNRQEALKVWIKNRPMDERDKRIQGFLEANALARAEGGRVPTVYRAGEVAEHFYCLMEYVPGRTLKEYIMSNERTLLTGLELGMDYIFLADEFGRERLIHGDPHWNNVILSDKGLVLLDFGTSFFGNKMSSFDRHWSIVAETFSKLVDPFPFFELRKSKIFSHAQSADVDLYMQFKECVPEWLFYLGIYPPARGVSASYCSRTGAPWALDDHIRTILDNLPLNKLSDEKFLGAHWFT